MRFSIVFLLVPYCLAFDLPHEGCKADLKINNDHYNVSETYRTGDAYPTDAHYDDQGNLFYVETGRNDKGFYFDIKMKKKMDKNAEAVPGLPEGNSYSIAIDKKDKKVYFGTGLGIFNYDYESHTASPISDNTLKLSMIFVDKDGNKYITESNNGIEELYLLDGKKKIRFHTLEALNELAIDDRNNFYFIKADKLFVLKSSSSEPTCIGDVSYDGIAQITVHKETVFIASENLMYFHEDEKAIKEVKGVPGKATAIAFEETGDFVLGVKGKMLKYKKNECYLRDISNNDVHVNDKFPNNDGHLNVKYYNFPNNDGHVNVKYPNFPNNDGHLSDKFHNISDNNVSNKGKFSK